MAPEKITVSVGDETPTETLAETASGVAAVEAASAAASAAQVAIVTAGAVAAAAEQQAATVQEAVADIAETERGIDQLWNLMQSLQAEMSALRTQMDGLLQTQATAFEAETVQIVEPESVAVENPEPEAQAPERRKRTLL